MHDIKYIHDKDFKYNEAIIEGLKSYNKSQAGYREKDYRHFYIFEDGTLIGACHTKMAVDWCHIKNIYYTNIDVLKALMNDLRTYYKDKVEGIRFNSVFPKRVDDFKSIGFVEKGKLKNMPEGGENVFLLNTDFDVYETNRDYEKKSSDDPVQPYDKVMKKENRKIRQSLNFSAEVVDIQYVVLDGDRFIGGVYGNFQYDYLFVNVLYVDEHYRGQNIASNLMDMIETEAKRRGVHNIYITTYEFQALGFYKKRGYEEVMEIYDYPKGFKEFTVHKRLDSNQP